MQDLLLVILNELSDYLSCVIVSSTISMINKNMHIMHS